MDRRELAVSISSVVEWNFVKRRAMLETETRKKHQSQLLDVSLKSMSQ